MALNASGQISIGGSTVGQSVNRELGRSATASSSLGESDLRTLAEKASGAISLSDFSGKSNDLAMDVWQWELGPPLYAVVYDYAYHYAWNGIYMGEGNSVSFTTGGFTYHKGVYVTTVNGSAAYKIKKTVA